MGSGERETEEWQAGMGVWLAVEDGRWGEEGLAGWTLLAQCDQARPSHHKIADFKLECSIRLRCKQVRNTAMAELRGSKRAAYIPAHGEAVPREEGVDHSTSRRAYQYLRERKQHFLKPF